MSTEQSTLAQKPDAQSQERQEKLQQVSQQHKPRKDGKDKLSDTTCHFFLERKKRYCNIPRQPGSQSLYCPMHTPSAAAAGAGTGSATERRRIPCPLDPAHTIFEDQLEHHVAICNEKKDREEMERQPWFLRNCNCGTLHHDAVEIDCAVNDELLIQKIENLYIEKVVPILRPDIEQFMPEECRDLYHDDEKWSRQHGSQQCSIIGHMNKYNQNNDNIIEWGCGKAELSYMVALSRKQRNAALEAKYLLIDRGTGKRKYDLRLSHIDDGIGVHRCKADIKDLALCRVEQVVGDAAASQRPWVSISKHLCGVATDLTLRCIDNCVRELGPEKQQQQELFPSVFIALCCHDKCRWQDYVAQDWILSECHLSKHEFERLCSMSSWCTGYRGAGSKPGADVDPAVAEERKRIGRLCKRIIDAGRVWFLKNRMGYQEAKLVHYVDEDTSPENALLIAVKQSSEK